MRAVMVVKTVRDLLHLPSLVEAEEAVESNPHVRVLGEKLALAREGLTLLHLGLSDTKTSRKELTEMEFEYYKNIFYV